MNAINTSGLLQYQNTASKTPVRIREMPLYRSVVFGWGKGFVAVMMQQIEIFFWGGWGWVKCERCHLHQIFKLFTDVGCCNIFVSVYVNVK